MDTPEGMVMVQRVDAERLARFALNNAGDGIRADTKLSAMRVFELCRAAPASPAARYVDCPRCSSHSEHELVCRRAAPAGGDDCKTCQGHGMIGWTTGQTPEQFDQHEAPCPDCSAPAWSGEVEEDIEALSQSLELMAQHRDEAGWNCDAECLRTAAALLRKLQQGADYVMVPRRLTEAMHLAYWNADNIHGDKVAITDITEGDRIILQRTWEDMIAASQDQQGDK